MATVLLQLTICFPVLAVLSSNHVMIYGFSKSDVFFDPTMNRARAGWGTRMLRFALKTLPGAALVCLNHMFRVRLIPKFKFRKTSSPVLVTGIVKILSDFFVAWSWVTS